MAHRVGLVGLRQARGFIDLFRSIPGVEVTALCDIDQEILEMVGEDQRIEARFTDFGDFLEADIDMVALSTPIQVHGSQGIGALKAGKHVLCQYVAAKDMKEAEELVSAAKSSGLKYMTIETDCYERKNLIMAEIVAQGALGELIMARGHYIHDCKTLGYNPDGSLTWRGELWMQSNGGLSCAVHTSLPILQAFGERVVEVFAYGPGSRVLPEFTWNDRVTTVGRLASGRVLEFVIDIFSWHPLRCGYTIQGSNGCFEFDRAAFVEEGKLSDWRDLDELEKSYSLDALSKDERGHSSAFHSIIHEFVRSVDEDLRPPQDLYDALHVTAIGWAAEESLNSGMPVKVAVFE